jgi:hypothetical protein
MWLEILRSGQIISASTSPFHLGSKTSSHLDWNLEQRGSGEQSKHIQYSFFNAPNWTRHI